MEITELELAAHFESIFGVNVTTEAHQDLVTRSDKSAGLDVKRCAIHPIVLVDTVQLILPPNVTQ
jgi:hypothetical protein